MDICSASSAHRCASIALLVATLLPLQAALAADLIVTKFTDSLDGSCDSDCSLREAVQKANQTPGASRIILAAGTYSLSIPPLTNEDFIDSLVDDDDNLNGDLDIRGRLTIVGRGIDVTNIDAGRIDRIAEVLPGATATLSKLTVRNGRQPFRGAGLDVNIGGMLNLQSCAVTNNFTRAAAEAGAGGGIWNGGSVNIDASRIDGNSSGAGEGFFGQGGGIHNLGSLTVRDALFTGNSASDDDDSGFGGAIFNQGTADIRRAYFKGNSVSNNGAGEAIFNGGPGTLRLENSTIGDDPRRLSPFGDRSVAAVENGDLNGTDIATARLVNVTIAGNAFGLSNHGRLSVVDSIVAGNGLAQDPDGSLVLIGENCSSTGPNAQFSQSGLLLGSDSGNCPATLLVLNADTFATELFPPASNGSQLPTFALRRGSIAVDAAIGSCPSTDQRRVSRPRDGNGDRIAACDLGAYER